VDEIPETPLPEDNKIIEEVSEILLQSTQNKPEIIKESSTPFYTPAELKSFGIIPEHEEQLDK
jgi:phosphoribosyl-ATP pyrophosphohydrolase